LCFAKINPSTRIIELSVEAKLNKNPIGRLTLVVDPDDLMSFKWDEMKDNFRGSLYDEKYFLLVKRVDGNVLTKKELEKFGVLVNFDLSDFSLKFVAPNEFLRPKNLSLKSNSLPLESIEQSHLSGFFNVYSSYFNEQDESDNESNEQLSIRSEMVFNWNKWVLENEEEYFSNATDEQSIQRLGTRLVHDLPVKGMRLSIGDNYSSGGYFQSTSRILGFSLAHDFALVSNRQIRPSASRSFALSSPSSVEVIVDNRVVKRLNLGTGTYSLDDIPINEGNNTISLRITDNVGVVQYINFDVTTGLDLFAKGDLKYELHFGVPAELKDQLEYTYDEPLFSGILDYGVTTDWTVGATVQMDEFLQQVGFKNIYASKIGQFSLENAVSFSDETGNAYRIVYNNFADNSVKHRVLSLGYEHSTENFRALGYRPNVKDSFSRREHLLQANYSFFITPTLQTSIFANTSKVYDQTQFDKSIGVSFSHELANGQFLYGVGGQWDQADGDGNWSARLSLTYKFSTKERINLSRQSGQNRTRLEFTNDSDQRYVGALNVRAGVEKNDQDKAFLDLSAQYNAHHFAASFDHASYYEDTDLITDSVRHQNRVNFSTSLAFTDDAWSIGKPIYDSFALVTAHSSLQNKTITLGQYDDKYVANNEGLDTILLNDIGSYSNSTITVDVSDLAPGYDIGSGILSFSPSYRSGHSVVIGTDANISVIATLLGKDNEPLGLLAGTAICISRVNKKEFQFFTNKRGRFALTGLIPCQYEITLKDISETTFMIDVEKGEQLQRKGDIYAY
tara:strand:- start:2124 stop:4493 length:2370 start_codon:yes stop_codon:yes gene_type:complete